VTAPTAAGRGRPRSEPARRAILGAATELMLARGLSAVSMDAIAEKAGVSKATIYRWWPTKETLALEALFDEWSVQLAAPPDTGSLREDLLALLLPWVERAGDRPYGRIVGALITEARTDPAFGELYRTQFIAPRRQLAGEALKRALARGEVAPGTDVEAAIDMLYGPIYHRLLHGHAPLTAEFVRTVVSVVVAGLRP
jgi:AcrR family transcriptional regulator